MSENEFKLSALTLALLFWLTPISAAVSACQLEASQTQSVPAATQSTATNPADDGRSAATTQSRTHRLRFTWGGGQAERWVGNIKFSDAEISRPTILGFNRDSSAFNKFDRNAITIDQNAASTFEGFDIDVRAGAQGTIEIEMSTTGGKTVNHQFPIAQLVGANQVFSLDELQNRFSVSRSPEDIVQFRSDHKHLIFEPGDKIQFEFKASQLPQPTVSTICQIDVCHARKGTSCTQRTTIPIALDLANSSQWMAHAVTVPEQEGVYNIRLQVGSSEDSVRFGKRQDSQIREVQFIVLDPAARVSEPGKEQLIAEINPVELRNPIVSQQLNQFSRKVGFRNINATAGDFQIDRNQNRVILPTGGWQAIPLNLDRTGQQHVVEIEYPSGQPMTLGLSVLQADSLGQVPVFGGESGIKVPAGIGTNHTTKQSDGGLAKHRFTFWPENKQLFLLIANRDEKETAEYRRIRIHSVTQIPPGQKPRSSAGKRQQMVFYEQPLFAENFSSQHYFDRQFGQTIADWETFLAGLRRLITHIKQKGASGAFVNVFGEGSALWPTENILANPRYDSGVFSSTGHDPIRKDVVELIYRMFEREGLSFVPVFAFDHRFAELEFNSAADHHIVNNRGQKLDVGEADLLPAYNPLSERLQGRVDSVLQEFVSRYGGRKSYEGVAVICRPNTCTLLPGVNVAGYDEETLQRFWNSQNTSAESNATATAASVLVGEMHQQWRQWRTDNMSTWYRRMQTIAAGNNQDAKLYLAFVDLFRNEEIASLVSPSLHRDVDVNEAMTRMGLDQKQLAGSSGIIYMQPQRVAPLDVLARKRSDTVVGFGDQLDTWFGNSQYSASLFMQRSQWARFEKLENSGYFAKQNHPIMRLQQIEMAGHWSCERFAQALLHCDSRMLADGGVLINTAVDGELREFSAVYCELPDEKFQAVPHLDSSEEDHPVAVRYLKHNDSDYLYCVNASPWTATVEMRFSGDRQLLQSAQMLGGEMVKQRSFKFLDDNTAQIELPPFGLVAFLNEELPKQTGFKYSFAGYVQNELRDSYYKLRSRLISSGNAHDLGVLANAGFEKEAFEDGWSSGGDAKQVRLKTDSANEGQQSLEINNTQDSSLWIRSNSFKPTATGRLSVSVWLKTADDSKQPPLRISVESNDSGSDYYRFAQLGSLVADKRMNQITEQWKRYAVHFDDLPQQSVQSYRIGFDMMGAGQVMIDDVQIYDRWLDEKDLKAMTQIFASVGPMIKQQEKFEACRQILSSYWPLFLQEYFNDTTIPAPASANSFEQNMTIDTVPDNGGVRSSMRKRFRRKVAPGFFQFR